MILSTKLHQDMGNPLDDITIYRSKVESLQYFSLIRNQVCQFLQNPKEGHLMAVRRILRYLQGTSNLGLQITKELTREWI